MIKNKLSEVVSLIETAKKEIQSLKNKEEIVFNILDKTDEALSCILKDKNVRNINSILVRKINALIASTGEKETAIDDIAKEFGISREICAWIYHHSNGAKKALYRYARHYTVVKMRNAGFNYFEIAKVLEVSPNYIYKLSTSDIPLNV